MILQEKHLMLKWKHQHKQLNFISTSTQLQPNCPLSTWNTQATPSHFLVFKQMKCKRVVRVLSRGLQLLQSISTVPLTPIFHHQKILRWIYKYNSDLIIKKAHFPANKFDQMLTFKYKATECYMTLNYLLYWDL